MKLEFITFNPEIELSWDKFVEENRLPLNYSYSALLYLSSLNNLQNQSFLVVREGIVALVPILLSYDLTQATNSLENFESQLFPFINSTAAYEDKIAIIEHLFEVLNINGPPKNSISFEVRSWCTNHSRILASMAEFYNFKIEEELNSDLVINFCTSDDLILRRNHLRNEKRSVQLGDTIMIHHPKRNLRQLELAFERFVDCFETTTSHKSSQKLNHLMLNMLVNGKGYLFESKNGDFSKSFLFCDANGVFARGWRQVNSLNLDKKENPRVLLEKTAIEFFRKEKYCSYHIGEIVQSPNVLDSKLASINHFKLGFNPIRVARQNVKIDKMNI